VEDVGDLYIDVADAFAENGKTSSYGDFFYYYFKITMDEI